MSVIWHDLECGGYAEDLALWRELAMRHGGPVLDVGAGTGRTAIMLARAGHRSRHWTTTRSCWPSALVVPRA